MQSVAAFVAGMKGIVYVNGRFAGECGPDGTLILPVSRENMLYCEFRPFNPRFIPCAGAVKISGGRAIYEDFGDGICMVQWPGNVLEVEFLPRSAFVPESEYGMIGEFPAAVIPGEGSLLRISGQAVGLPAGAKLPDEYVNGACHAFLGDVGKGRYMACFHKGDMTPVGMILGDKISEDGEGRHVCFTALNDIVGHVRMETWEIGADGPYIIGTEYGWGDGGPKWPEDAESAALAALQAGILGLWDEAEGYIDHLQRGKGVVKGICEGADGAVALSYPAPGARKAVGILKNVARGMGVVEEVYYKGKAEGGAQGMWTVEFLST